MFIFIIWILLKQSAIQHIRVQTTKKKIVIHDDGVKAPRKRATKVYVIKLFICQDDSNVEEMVTMFSIGNKRGRKNNIVYYLKEREKKNSKTMVDLYHTTYYCILVLFII